VKQRLPGDDAALQALKPGSGASQFAHVTDRCEGEPVFAFFLERAQCVRFQ
jgi:hypothetical protein